MTDAITLGMRIAQRHPDWEVQRLIPKLAEFVIRDLPGGATAVVKLDEGIDRGAWDLYVTVHSSDLQVTIRKHFLDVYTNPEYFVEKTVKMAEAVVDEGCRFFEHILAETKRVWR